MLIQQNIARTGNPFPGKFARHVLIGLMHQADRGIEGLEHGEIDGGMA